MTKRESAFRSYVSIHHAPIHRPARVAAARGARVTQRNDRSSLCRQSDRRDGARARRPAARLRRASAQRRPHRVARHAPLRARRRQREAAARNGRQRHGSARRKECPLVARRGADRIFVGRTKDEATPALRRARGRRRGKKTHVAQRPGRAPALVARRQDHRVARDRGPDAGGGRGRGGGARCGRSAGNVLRAAHPARRDGDGKNAFRFTRGQLRLRVRVVARWKATRLRRRARQRRQQLVDCAALRG